MYHKNEFMKYATRHLGMSSMHLEKYAEKTATTVPNIQAFTPQVIEERQMNIVGMDVFSRLMMDRIIFMGVPVNDYVANVIQARRSTSWFSNLLNGGKQQADQNSDDRNNDQ